MAKGQKSMFDNETSRRKFYSWNKNNKVVKSKSNSQQTTFKTPNGKEFSLLTTHGKFVRNKEELALGKNKFTGKNLSDFEKGIRLGFNMALGEQAKSFNKKESNKK